MPRALRIFLPGIPFHVTHRGNQRREVFRSDDDYRAYLQLIQKYSRQFDMRVWAYCLMPNHVHLLALGMRRDSLSAAVGNAQRVYSRRRHMDAELTGHLWGTRYFASPLDEAHTWAAVRYIERNPVKAGLVSRAVDYPWSSARAHAGLAEDELLDPDRPFPGLIGDWQAWLAIAVEEPVAQALRRNTASGRPTGSEEFVRTLEKEAGRRLRRLPPGPQRDSRHRNPG
jgi:putative transposase